MRRSSASSLHPFDSSDEMESWGGGTDGWGGWGAMFPPLFDFQGTLFMANQPHMAVHHFCSYTHLTTSTFKCLPPFSPSGGCRDIRDQTWHPVPSVHQHFAVPVKQCKIPPLLSLFFPTFTIWNQAVWFHQPKATCQYVWIVNERRWTVLWNEYFAVIDEYRMTDVRKVSPAVFQSPPIDIIFYFCQQTPQHKYNTTVFVQRLLSQTTVYV